MNEIDRCLQANHEFAERFPYRGLDPRPTRRVAIVTCMDARMLKLDELLGLDNGEAHTIRNAGGIVTDDVLRSLLLSRHLLGTREILVINHTECGLHGLSDDALIDRLSGELGDGPAPLEGFLGFEDLEENVRAQVARVRAHQWIPRDTSVRGFVYDVASGRLEEVPERE